jgi:hypothetical protein
VNWICELRCILMLCLHICTTQKYDVDLPTEAKLKLWGVAVKRKFPGPVMNRVQFVQHYSNYLPPL